jgi:cohesin loading factor subunit SCC2
MLLPVITKSVARRLTDESISVREAALSLVGSYVVRSPAVANAFHTSLLARLTDTGVSVRKRAVRIFESILTSNPSYKGRSSVFDTMLQRAADPKEEDGVRDLIENLFSHLWLENGNLGVSASTTPDLASVEQADGSPVTNSRIYLAQRAEQVIVSPLPVSKWQDSRQCRAHLAAEQMIEVVRSAGSTVHLEELLKKFLGAEADGDKGRKLAERNKRKELDQKQCEKIVKSLFEWLVSVEEEREIRGNRFGDDLAATLRTIAVFSEVSPEFVFSNVDSVLPYLKADNGLPMEKESPIVAAVCEIIYRLANAFNQEVVERLSSTSTTKDLTQIAYQFGPYAFSSAIRAFSCLAQQSDSIFSKRLLDLGRTFYTFLCKRDHVTNFEKSDVSTHMA